MVLSRRTVTIRSDTSKFEPLNRLPVDLALELEVGNTQVDVVLVKLVEDIESGIVTSVGSIGVGNARGVQGVAVGVDIEAAAVHTVHHVNVLAQCTRSALLAVAVAGEQLDGQALRQVVAGVGVEGVALYLTLLGPSWVIHYRCRGVEPCAVGTTRDRDGVVLRHVAVEQQVKPVGVAELCLTQVGVLGSKCVRQAKGSCLGVILVHELVHGTIYTRARRVGKTGKAQPSLGLEFLVDTHLLLRVTDVELTVHGFQAIGELASVVDAGLS